jgi:formamidopyrimidine-DNA glycosylase
MPELPEIIIFARQMKKELVGKTIGAIEVLQPKSLNVPEEEFVAGLTGAQITDVTPRGKWLFVETPQGWLLLSLGMGGEILRLQLSIDKGGAGYEMNLYGQKGGFTMENIFIGYREGEPCPACGTPIEKIKTGSTSSFICPRCQPLDG